MKALLAVITFAVVGAFLWQNAQRQPRPGEPVPPSTDPVKSMEELVALLPPVSHWGKGGGGTRFDDVAYNVKKTDSLVTPLVGTIDFVSDGVVHYQIVFQRSDDRWFVKGMYNQHTGRDASDASFLAGTEMRPFLHRCNWRPAALDDPRNLPIEVSTPKPTPPPLSREEIEQQRAQAEAELASQRTRAEAERLAALRRKAAAEAAEIARKYGGR